MRLTGTNIVVDSFKRQRDYAVYFLTHMHSDHTAGLSPSWDLGTIYCSEQTRVLIERKWGLDAELLQASACCARSNPL